MDIDLNAVMLGSRLALKYMNQQRGGGGAAGVILNTASLAGLYPQAFQPAYAAAKGGVVHFTRSLAQQFKNSDIRINAICRKKKCEFFGLTPPLTPFFSSIIFTHCDYW